MENLAGFGNFLNTICMTLIQVICASGGIVNESVRRILIVDDDESTRWIVGKTLARFRAELIFAESATEAKRSIERHPGIDLVICDYNMGSENGIEVLFHLRLLKKRIPFLLFTAEENALTPLIEFENASLIRKPELTTLASEVGRLLH